MELYSTQFATFGVIFAFLLLFLQFYINFKKKYAGFPIGHVMPYVIYRQITGKITKDFPINHVILQKMIDLGKKHAEEGLFMTFLTTPVLLVFGENVVKTFAYEKSAADKSPEYMIFKDTMGTGFALSNGERWRSRRKLISPAFNLGTLKESIPLFNEHAMALVTDLEKLVDKPSVDILKALKCRYFNALSESVFGLKQDKENAAQNLKFGEHIDSVSAIIVKRVFFPWLRPKFLFLLFSIGRQYYQHIKEVEKFIHSIISEMKGQFSSNKIVDSERFSVHSRKSFTYILLNQHLKDPTFTFKDIQDEAAVIMAAGYDTVTYSSMWCLYLLGLHQDIQEKVYDEIQSVTSDYITYEETSNLVYLESVIMESLRLYPVLPIFSRSLSENVQCGKYKVYKDTTIVLFPYLTNRDPKVFPDPELFNPERFLNVDKTKRSSFIPFAEGFRSCIGKNYALIEMKIFLAHSLRNFVFTSLDKREDVRLCWNFVLTPVKPLRMKITPRNNASF